ncbi:MAG TPA: phosphoribosyltransferase family protein [Candidatus Saccharimonadales bacterium]|nr:phosphoribosyltransferase family protein [Candidatus Saccharimonadales bacterium]
MSIFDILTASFAPHECLSCGQEGHLLCKACTHKLSQIPERCYRCRRLSAGNRSCEACRRMSKLYSLKAGTIYEGLAKDLVWRLKFQGAQTAAHDMARYLAPMVESRGVVIVHVPTATGRVRRRGYDQAYLLARALAKQTQLPHLAALARLGQHHQVGASRRERTTQLAQAFIVLKPELVQNSHILLVDDVLTTGATLEAAARALKLAGAKRVDGLVFAQA